MNALRRVFLTATLAVGSVCLTGMMAQAANDPIVRVESETITQATLNAAIAKYHGTERTVLTKLVYMSLIRQEAKKAGVWPSERDEDQRIEEIRRRSPEMLAKLDSNPSLMNDFKSNLRVDIAFENLRIQHVKVTDAQIAAFYNANKQALAMPQQVKTTLVVTQSKADADTAMQLLKASAKDTEIARHPGMHVVGVGGYSMNMDRLSADEKKAISAAVFSMKPGEIKILPIMGEFLIIKIKNNNGTGVPTLSQVKPTVSRALRLQKAPSPQYVLASLYQNAHPQFQSGKYESYFYDIEKFDLKAAPTSEKAVDR